MRIKGITLTEVQEAQLWADFVESRPKNPWNGEPSLPSRPSLCEQAFRRYVTGRIAEDDYLTNCDAWGQL